MNDIGIKICPDGSDCIVWYYRDQDDKIFFYVPNAKEDEMISTATSITNLIKIRDYAEFSSDSITHETLHKVVHKINGPSYGIDWLQNQGVVP